MTRRRPLSTVLIAETVTSGTVEMHGSTIVVTATRVTTTVTGVAVTPPLAMIEESIRALPTHPAESITTTVRSHGQLRMSDRPE